MLTISEDMTDTLGGYVSDCARLLRKRFDAAARQYNITGAQWRVLIAVDLHPGINQGQLAERLEVEPITTCRMVDRLVQAGLIERRRHPTDRRAWSLFVTDGALPVIGTVRQVGAQVIDRALAGFSEDEKDMMGGMLERLRANLLDDAAFTTEVRKHG